MKMVRSFFYMTERSHLYIFKGVMVGHMGVIQETPFGLVLTSMEFSTFGFLI